MSFYGDYPIKGGGGGVTSLNGLTGALTLLGAGGITITPSGSNITITGTGGTVTSVGLALPASLFAVTGSPVTTSGTLTGTLATKSANTVFAGPTSGGAATPTFRALVSADIPSLSALYANTALSNLGTTAINADLIPASNQNLGTAANPWSKEFLLGLYDSSGLLQVNLTSRFLVDSSGTATSIDWDNRILYASDGSESLDYQNRRLIDSSNNTAGDWSIRTFTNAAGFKAIDYSAGLMLFDSGANTSIDVSNRQLLDSATNTSIDYKNRQLFDSTSIISADYNVRQLFDATGTTVLDWYFSGVKLSTNLVPDAVGARNVGTSSTPFLGMASNSYYIADNFGDIIGTIQQSSGGPGVGTGLQISANFASGPSFYGPILFNTANNASGPSGDMVFTTGTATTTRGSVRVNALVFGLPQASADPTGTTGGEMYFNTTSNKIKVFNGTTWETVTSV